MRDWELFKVLKLDLGMQLSEQDKHVRGKMRCGWFIGARAWGDIFKPERCLQRRLALKSFQLYKSGIVYDVVDLGFRFDIFLFVKRSCTLYCTWSFTSGYTPNCKAPPRVAFSRNRF